MKGARWLALAVGAGLGTLGGCFTAPELTGAYQCSQQGTCPDESLSCVDGVCCKYDGGEPACAAMQTTDGGADGGPDAGEDAGQDAGCTVPSPDTCPLSSLQGLCGIGTWSCATGVLVCNQVHFGDAGELCNGLDEDCDGITDNYPPCGGPASFLLPDAAYVVGAEETHPSATALPRQCLKGLATNTPEYFDGTFWRAQGPAVVSSSSQFAYAEAADGGRWDLSRPGQALNLAFTGYLTNPATPPFSGFSQPLILLCSQGGGWRRYSPFLSTLMNVNEAARTFSLNTIVSLRDGGGSWTPAEEGGGFSLDKVQRVEIMLDLRAATSGQPGFDAGFTAFGFSPP